eukprot:m.7501 g.7501  ORF g.7501 m.7501 type:complete len:483 (+) comp2953_c0_seq2:281-1729(+)
MLPPVEIRHNVTTRRHKASRPSDMAVHDGRSTSGVALAALLESCPAGTNASASGKSIDIAFPAPGSGTPSNGQPGGRTHAAGLNGVPPLATRLVEHGGLSTARCVSGEDSASSSLTSPPHGHSSLGSASNPAPGIVGEGMLAPGVAGAGVAASAGAGPSSTAAASPAVGRVVYTACPLCGGCELGAVATVPCHQHPLYQPCLPPNMTWLRCSSCHHVFTDGYFDDAALGVIFSRTNPHQRLDNPVHAEAQRYVCAGIVATVASLGDQHRRRQRHDHSDAHHGATPTSTPRQQPTPISSTTTGQEVLATLQPGYLGRWLDVGCGNGALLATAAEFGFDAYGIDVRADAVQALQSIGYQVACVSFEHAPKAVPFKLSVISMADLLEHLPYPRQALHQVHEMLEEDGLLFVSMPNMQCMTWKLLDLHGLNPYWAELEHFHNFDRARLYRLLAECGFVVIHYGVSRRYQACMEVIARRVTIPDARQ